MSPQPTLFIPHGGGPCFFMEWTLGPPDTWNKMADWLASLPSSLPAPPKALLVVSAHWETPALTLTGSESPPLLYDYGGFPAHTYELTWPAPGSPELVRRARSLLGAAGFDTQIDEKRGFDHGVFVPLKVAYPEATIPTVQLSLRRGLEPREHLAMGRALAPLRDEGVLIVGSGMSYHNMRGFRTEPALAQSEGFDAWLTQAVTDEPGARDRALATWSSAPFARECHPREEHLLPLMVVAGAAGEDRGKQIFKDQVMGVVVSAVRFG